MNIALEYTVDYNVDHHCLCYVLNKIRLGFWPDFNICKSLLSYCIWGLIMVLVQTIPAEVGTKNP